MKKIFLALAIGAMMLTACDKVDEYTTPAGAVGEWSEGSGVADKSQRAYVEKYTGARCPNCPKGDVAIEAAHAIYGDKLIAAAIDCMSDFGKPFPGQPNTHTEEGDAWASYFITKETPVPITLINREKENDIWKLCDISSIASTVESVVNSPAKIAIAMEQHTSAEQTNILVNLEYLEAISEPLTLTVLVVEDSIVFKQLTPDGTIDPNYSHNHVLRDVVTDLWGMDIDAQGTKGERRKVTINYSAANTVVEPALNINNCHLIAFVSYKESREILNAVSCKL